MGANKTEKQQENWATPFFLCEIQKDQVFFMKQSIWDVNSNML